LHLSQAITWISKVISGSMNDNINMDSTIARSMNDKINMDSTFRAKQSLLFLLNAACFAEKQQIPILVFGLTRSGLEPTIYCT
jgi:hypothetical protein